MNNTGADVELQTSKDPKCQIKPEEYQRTLLLIYYFPIFSYELLMFLHSKIAPGKMWI